MKRLYSLCECIWCRSIYFYRLTEDWSRREDGERKVRGIFDLEFVITEQVLTECGICYMTNNFLTEELSTRYSFFMFFV